VRPNAPRTVGRYVLFDPIAAGGMASVYLGRLKGAAGFERTVAIKCLHPGLTRDAETVSMLIDEAHIASRIRAPNVVPILDVISEDGEIFLVMEYVHGESLAKLLREVARRGDVVAPALAVGITVDFLRGLHAAHEARADDGSPLGIVHRDVSPQNVMVGADGVSRIVDFGIAKAASRAQTTQEGQIKGKLGYMAPEQLRSEPVDGRTDAFAAAIVLWEMLAGRRLFEGDDAGSIVGRVLLGTIPSLVSVRADVPPELGAVLTRAMSRDPAERYPTAAAFADALATAVKPAPAAEIAAWVADVAADSLADKVTRIAGLADRTAERGTAQREDVVTARTLAVPDADATARSVTRDDVAPPPSAPRRRAGGWAVALVVFAVGAIVTAATLRGGQEDDNTVKTAEAAASVPLPASAASVTGAASNAAPSPVVSAASASSASVVAPRVVAPGREPTQPPRPPAAKPACDPPYVIKNGIKTFKPECL
jgi:serine/threonine-protein kinase